MPTGESVPFRTCGLDWGASGIRHPDLIEDNTPGDRRTLTLVLAKERTLDGLRDALRAGYTAVWLIGREEALGRLMKQCVQATPIHDAEGKTIVMRVVNDSDIPIHLKRLGDVGSEEITLDPNSLNRVPLEIEGSGKRSDPVDFERERPLPFVAEQDSQLTNAPGI